ncbi:Hpt domain-containing protein [Xenorhabdus sp. SF857]|uniref:Hpt domain-containing protein n=1 Tax=Xenorhabdus bakwenae TaxID=3026967 RepID=UPI002557D361|nr:Hpt domain-containing protein [Xenorhabdus sp. SF857]WFQ80826.1 Hpt domain-containing protein [Xenorhabdus sp. SF857]
MDITAFYQTFFDEADELLADMEQHLLLLDADEPDHEQLNAIFRSAHSIKGGLRLLVLPVCNRPRMFWKICSIAPDVMKYV